MSVKTAYLVLFNLASSLGWACVLGQTFQLVYTDQDIALSSAKLWGVIETLLKIVQTMAIFEVLHALFGLVRSPVGSTFMQGTLTYELIRQVPYLTQCVVRLVSSRLFLVWAINVLCPDSRYHWGFILMVASWSLVEVPRYAFYALNLLDAVCLTSSVYLSYIVLTMC